MSGAADDARALLLLLTVGGDQDDIKQQRLSRISLQQTLVHSLQRLKSKTCKKASVWCYFISFLLPTKSVFQYFLTPLLCLWLSSPNPLTPTEDVKKAHKYVLF